MSILSKFLSQAGPDANGISCLEKKQRMASETLNTVNGFCLEKQGKKYHSLSLQDSGITTVKTVALVDLN